MLLRSTGLLLLLLVVPNTSSPHEPCKFPFFYANTGFDFADDDVTVSIACLDPAGCGTIVLASASCGGCFNSGCVTENKRMLTEVVQGETLSVSGLELASGDMVCSTGQVSVVSKDSYTTNDEAHEWPGNDFAGQRFAYLTERASSARCTLFAFEESEVTLMDEDGTTYTTNMSAFSSQTFGTFDAEEKVLSILTSRPVLASCWTSSEDDFVVLEPVTTDPIYGFASKHFRGVQVNCDTLANVLDVNNLPTCTNSNGEIVSLSLKNGDHFFEVSGEQTLEKYRGPGVKCTPAPGFCIAGGTVGDGDGFEGTSAFSVRGFARYFVLPEEVRQVVLLSPGVPVACTYQDADGAMRQLLTSAPTNSSEVFAAAAGSSVVFPKGTSFDCSDEVYFVASHGDDEFNLFGLKSKDAFSYRPPAYATCAPTTRPPSVLTPSVPSQSPNSYPGFNPGDNTTGTRGSAANSVDVSMLTGWSLFILLAVGTVLLLVFSAFRKHRDDDDDETNSVGSMDIETIDGQAEGVGRKNSARPKRLPAATMKRFSIILEQLAEEDAEERASLRKQKVDATRKAKEARNHTPTSSPPYLPKIKNALDGGTRGNGRRESSESVLSKIKKFSLSKKPKEAEKPKGRRPSRGIIPPKTVTSPSSTKPKGRGSVGEMEPNAELLLAISKFQQASGFEGEKSTML